MLSREVALNFLEKTLHIEKVEEKLKEDRLSFLNEIIEAQHEYIPYQTFDMIGTEAQKRKNPSLEECIEANLNRKGGVCVTLQAFFFALLRALDYNTYLVVADVFTSALTKDHVVVIVKDIQESGDKYYVDVGTSYPCLIAVPLHKLKDGEFELYQFHFVTMRMSRVGQSFVRSHKRKDSEGNYYWQDFFTYNPDMPKDFSYFDDIMHTVFTDELQSHFLKNCFASLYLPDTAITVKNLTVKIWHKDTKAIEQLDFDSIEEASEKVSALFPMIPSDVIKKGFQAWKQWEERNAGKPKFSCFNLL